MSLKGWQAVILATVLLVGGVYVYSGGTSTPNGKVEHSGIQIGTSIVEVREILGEPDHEQTFDNGEATIDTTLYYGDYQLVFDKGYLRSKNKY
jgi:hypothetical protein